jgi:antibiotic biosynthesis monooxygenase (ABM) superfamily enzyme
MIVRVWHGWTTQENADAYERLLKTEIFPGIAAKNVPGYRSIELLRRPVGDEVEFATVMQFDDWKAVRDFAGDDYEAAYVPEKARKVLSRFRDRSRHYERRERLDYQIVTSR